MNVGDKVKIIEESRTDVLADLESNLRERMIPVVEYDALCEAVNNNGEFEITRIQPFPQAGHGYILSVREDDALYELPCLLGSDELTPVS